MDKQRDTDIIIHQELIEQVIAQYLEEHPPEAPAGGGLFDAYAYLRDEKSSGTNGGSPTAGAWNTRTLNTEVFDPDGIVTLASNQFTLQAGTYFIKARSPGLFTSRTKTRIRNITDGVTVGVGANDYSDGGGVTSEVHNWVMCRVVLAAAKTFELQHFPTSSGTFGVEYGNATTGTGEVEVYSEVEIYREAA